MMVNGLDRTSITDNLMVHITVLDENDSPPTFARPVYQVNISEEARSGSPVTRLMAHDADTGSNAQISYSIVSGNDGRFTIDRDTGQIWTSGQLDRETVATYTLGVRASDGRQFQTATLEVSVQDTNDNDPAFTESTYSFSVLENHAVGTVLDAVTATDPDAGTNGEVVYSIVAEGAPGEDIFSLDSLTGEFTLLTELDFEEKQVYFLTVRANDRGTVPRSTTASVYFSILDVNDNEPVFNPTSYWVEVAEDVAVGTEIVMVTATDADSGSNAEIVFTISSGDPTSRFTIYPNGSLSTIIGLDREMQSFYNLEITATDQAADLVQQKSTTAQVTVIVLDINDNAPVFTTGNHVSVREDTSRGDVVMFVHAVDADVEKNSYIAYSLSPVPGNVFLINSVDGNIRLLNDLDRESVPEYTITVHATDKGQPAQSSSMDIVIEVLDINDNNPIFVLDSYHSSLPEDVPVGLEFLQVSATDADEGINAELRFSIFNGNYDSDFTIDPTSGVLSVANPLDRERRLSYSLVVRAQDSGDGLRIASTTVTITVQDINDNAPEFLTPYTPRIQENNQLGALVTQVSATDEDEGTNGRLTYSIEGNSYDGLFTIVPDSGEIHVARSLDREVEDSYALKIVAEDAGSPPRQGSTDIVITVTDDNDNPPQFELPSYTVTLQEEVGSNTPVLQVSATDADSTADLRYRLDSAIGNKFTINPISGQILTTSGRLDREEQANYFITVTVEDGGTWTRQTTVRVNLQDINDNAPRFVIQSYQALLPATTPAGAIVLGVEAQDADIGDNAVLTYSITSGDTNKFAIDASTGVITTAQALTLESTAYILEVSVSDSSPTHAAATAMVQVTFSTSSQFPSFQSPSSGTVYQFDEDVANGTEVVTLQASSPKTGPEGTVTYHITGGNIENRFDLDAQSGLLTIARGLDYEVNQHYSLLLEARDGSSPPLTTSIQIVVNVNDVNDNFPVFDLAKYSGRVIEGQPAGTSVIQVQATDADSGTFGNIQYALRFDGNTNNNFRIDPASGWLETNRGLDRETVPEYTLMVQAQDQGSPAKTTVVTVHVTVEDINDSPVSFTNLFSATVPENSPVNTRVVTITTTDPDTVKNVEYAITDGGGSLFAIDPVTGQIRVNGTLDREATSQYQLDVSADDGSYRKDTTVTITISDVNDNAPAFLQPSYSVSLPEGLPAGSAAAQVSAQDLDAGVNQDVFYTMKTMSDHFIINEDTGYITISTPVDYIQPVGSSDPNVYHLQVLARDLGVPSLYSEVQVTVTIYDANEYPPVFEETDYFSPVPSNTAVDTSILQVVATESSDQGQNAQIQYTIIGGNGSSRFDIDQDSGWIKVKLSLQSDIGNYYDIIVEAEDQGRPAPLSTQVNVQLLVTGSNDNTPAFDQSSYVASVVEDLPVGSEVTVVTANDGDTGVNGRLSYSIIGGNEAGLFAIGEDTGSVTVAKALDYEEFTSHTIQIKARDQGWQSKEGNTILTVNLLDVDDNPPIFNPNQYRPQVAENSPSGTYVTTVTATDADSSINAEFTYDIIGGDGEDSFTINRNTGVIRTQGELDFERGLTVFQLSVVAANEDTTMVGRAHVTVELTGVNEFYPQFGQPSYQFSVSEAAADRQVVGMVYASDADHGPDGQVQYLLIGASNRKGFAIEPHSGEIIVSWANGRLDRETEDTVLLSVLARNNEPITGDNVDEVQVTVTILDANDPPQFVDDLYQARVSEVDGVGTYVTTVTAVEYDQNNNFRQFSYAIVDGNQLSAFEIDAVSGIITVASTLDRETVATYRLQVGAIDTGVPPKTGYTEVVVDVDDVNDNGPIFLPGNDVGYISENEASNTVVMTLNATDPDLNSNPALFTFILVPNADSPSFTLESGTNVLRTTRTLDREVKSDYYLSIESRDGGMPEMTAVSTIHIIVVDQNDNPSSERDARIEVKAYQSVFPGGSLGVVRPIDLDTGDVFVCQIVSGDLNIFSLQPGCVLNSRMHSTESDYDLVISGNDGQHSSVTSNFDVSFRAFNNASLTDSIAIRLSDVVPETFLSNHFDRFSASVSSYLSTRETLLILSLNNVEDDATKMDLILAIKRDSVYLAREEVAKLITDHKSTITSQSGVSIEEVDYSPCSPNPCRNSGTCQDRIELRHTTVITDSSSIIFVTPSIKRVFRCICQGEFFGEFCEEQINQCDPDPCLNGGVCTDLIGDYRCSCPLGYTGKQCGTNIDDCADGPCLNNGVCEDLVNGYSCHCTEGYSGKNCQNGPCALQPCQNGGTCIEEGSSFRCECQYGESGDICEITSIGFQQGSYMEFPVLSPEQNIITLHFTTVLPNALLIYNHDGKSTADAEFLTLEVVAGKVQFSYNLGDGVTVITTEKMVADGQWHKVEARRIGKDGELIVDDCSMLSPAGTCRASGGTGSQIGLDLNGVPMSLGGTMSIDTILPRAWQVSSADFLGCIREVSVNGSALDLSAPLAERGTGQGCDRDTETCSSSPCSGSSVCVDEWWNHWCKCEEGFTGANCDKVPTPFSFGGGSYVEYVVKESFRRQQLLDAAKENPSGRRRRRETPPGSQTISMSFRTGSPTGLLLLVESGDDFTTLRVINSTVQYHFGSSGQTKGSVSLAKNVANWKWHTINLYREGATITLESGDQTESQRFNPIPHDFTALEVTSMSLGGTKTPVVIDGTDVTAFSGCLENFKINGAALPLDGANDMFEAVPSENTGEGCDGIDVCSPNPCLVDQICMVDGDGFRCECKAGFTGEDCKIPSTGPPESDNTLVIVLVSVFAFVVIVIIVGCLLLLRRYRNKARKAKEIATGNSKTNFSMDSLDNPGFSADTFDNPTMIGSQHNKTGNGAELISQQPDIIEQNTFSGMPEESFIVDSDDVVIGEEASGRDQEAPEHYDLENASSIAPSDIEPAYHYRYYHDGRERKQKRHGYRYSPNPMLARIGTPPCESPVSQVSSNHLNITHNPNPNSLHVRSSPSNVQHSTPMENIRASPANALARQSPGLQAMRQSPSLQLLKNESSRSATPLRLSRANTPVRNAASPIGSEHSYNQSELRSQGHRSDISSHLSGQGDQPAHVGAHRPPRPPSRLKETSPVDASRPLGLTVEEVKRLNTARPDLMSGSHASTIDNLSSVSSSKRQQQQQHQHHSNLPPLPPDLEPSPLLEPPESTSSDETAGSFTCSEVESDTEKLKSRKLDPGRLFLSGLSQMDDEEGDEPETYEQFSAPFQSKEGLDSVGGSLSTLFASEDEHVDPKKTNGQFSWDQFLNWGPRFETLEGVFVDIALLQDRAASRPPKKVYLEQTAEEFV
ncbi:protocadherin Fat 4-like isoform X2 [Acanthaster planci]|uniref:Protocadherin Fat 4-like isoform X2 n=1 Tax=Acanthaster planci TaxID=133434 RepID=A0A8B7YGT5_ACAPL|nr:protocadherin Fat 4-like isoform X2 [Acanthaster planci]